MKFRESDIELMISHDFTETQIAYLKAAKMELPATRKQFRSEAVEHMSGPIFIHITSKFAEMGLINNPRNTTERMELTEKGKKIANQTGKGPKYSRFPTNGIHYKLELYLRAGRVKAKTSKCRTFYYLRESQ